MLYINFLRELLQSVLSFLLFYKPVWTGYCTLFNFQFPKLFQHFTRFNNVMFLFGIINGPVVKNNQWYASHIFLLSGGMKLRDAACFVIYISLTFRVRELVPNQGGGESNPHGCQTRGAVRGYSFRGFWLGDMPFFLLNALWIHLQLVAAVNGKYSFSLLLYIPHCGHTSFVDLPAVLLPLFWGQFFQFVCLLFLFVVNGTDNIHAYHLTFAIIMIIQKVTDCACHTAFYSTLKSGRRDLNPHGYQTWSAARGLQHLQIWLGDMPFFQLNYVLWAARQW